MLSCSSPVRTDVVWTRLSEPFRELRQQKGLSQEALADVARIGRSYMSGIERGVRNCSVLHLLKIARALGVNPADLFRDW
jgi:transcriptional regulator with XRE-family HTH domain